ncbi:hypothetical protein ANTRET_LOCUS3262 [Anthophora retusa]
MLLPAASRRIRSHSGGGGSGGEGGGGWSRRWGRRGGPQGDGHRRLTCKHILDTFPCTRGRRDAKRQAKRRSTGKGREEGMEYNPHFQHRRRTTTLPPLPTTVPDDE